MSKELLNALDALETEKGIKKGVIIDALEQALVSAYKKNYGQAQNVKVTFDARRGDIKVFAVKEVVNEALFSLNSGNVTMNSVQALGTLVTSIIPERESTYSLTIDRPRPVPSCERDLSPR